MDPLEQEVRRIVSHIAKVPAERLTPDTDLRVELNVDSLQGLQIVAALERRFAVTVPDDELDNYTTVRAITETVRRLGPSIPG